MGAEYFGGVKEERLLALARLLLEKLSERSGQLVLVLKRFLKNYDKDGSGELDLDEFAGAMRDLLPGVKPEEIAALADRFDADGSASLTIAELSSMLLALHRDPAAGLPPARETRKPPPSSRRRRRRGRRRPGSTTARRRPARRRRRATPAAKHADSPSKPRTQNGHPGLAPPGAEGFEDRLDNFLAKLSGRVAAIANEAHAALPPTARLPARRDMLVRQLGQRALREALDGVRSSEYVKLTPTQLYDALAQFRTPGQSLLPSRDAAGEAGERAAGPGRKRARGGAPTSRWAAPLARPAIPARKPERRRKGTDADTYLHASDGVKGAAASAEALRLRYKTCRTLVQPPVGWRKTDLAKSVKKSSQAPTTGLHLEHCFGYTSDLPGPNLALAFHGDEHRIVYNSAACAVVQNIETGHQRVFRGHTDDVTCIATDASGTLGATGQCASTDVSPYVCVWSVADVAELRKFGGDGSIARMVCAVGFFDDSSHIVAVGGDDRHTLRVYDLNSELGDDAAVIVAPCKAGVQPPAVTGLYTAPRDTARRFGNDHLVVTVGKGHLAFWLIDLPRRGKPGANRGRDASSKPPYEYQKRLPTYTPHKAPSATHAVAFVHRDDAVVTGASDGRVYIWRDFKVVHHFEAHGLGLCGIQIFNPTSIAANVGGAGAGAASGKGKARDPNAPTVKRNVPKKAFLSGFESQRGSGATGVSDLLLHPLDHSHVLAGLGFGDIVICDLATPSERKTGPGTQTLVVSHHASVQGLAAHPEADAFVTVGLDCVLVVWDASAKTASGRLSLRSGGTAVGVRGGAEQRFDDHVAVGFNTGAIEVFAWSSLASVAYVPNTTFGGHETISCLVYSPNGRILAVGSHDNAVYLCDAARDYAPRKKLLGHSSYIKNMDFSFDNTLLQTQDSIESDTQWHTWTLTLGFPVMGITLEASDGTDVNAASASRDRRLILSGDDSGHVKLFNGPATCRWAAHRAYWGHSSHCLGVSFLAGGGYVASCGGRDAAVLLWKIVPKALGVDDGADGEEIVKPPSARPAWYEGCELHSTIDILRKAAPMA
ncbi:hypothetical protein JL721_11386 [Aureococcus anophagefferens]|nr:hypothetical protein JL721_11386 [Aureococcus anophagefferens]